MHSHGCIGSFGERTSRNANNLVGLFRKIVGKLDKAGKLFMIQCHSDVFMVYLYKLFFSNSSVKVILDVCLLLDRIL